MVLAKIQNGNWVTTYYSNEAAEAKNVNDGRLVHFKWKLMDGHVYGFMDGIWKRGITTEQRFYEAIATTEFDRQLEELMKE